MTEKHIELLAKSSKVFYELSSFAKNNPAIKSPLTEQEYDQLAADLMQVIRDSYSK